VFTRNPQIQNAALLIASANYIYIYTAWLQRVNRILRGDANSMEQRS
jgi:hypothetical protein